MALLIRAEIIAVVLADVFPANLRECIMQLARMINTV